MMREPFNETAVEVHEAQEGLYLLQFRGWPLRHSCHLDWIHANLTFRNDKAEVLNAGLFEFAFVVAEEEFMFAKSFEEQSGDMSMFLDGLREDENVIEVNTDDSFHDEVLEDVVHHSLEGGGRISESEKHHQRFKESTICTKCCLPLITFFHPNIVVTPSYVELRKVLRATELVDKF
jgi:hypothetical protein